MTSKPRSVERIEAHSFRRQQIAFSLLTLFVLGVLLILHTLFAALLGEPSKAVILFLGLAFSLKALELFWLQGCRDGISERVAKTESAVSGIGIFALALVLAYLTNRDDSPYFVLFAIPILQCAYHFSLFTTVSTSVASVIAIFAWSAHYFAIHPPPRLTEYLESGMISVIYLLIGPLVWYLVNQLGTKQTLLYKKMLELESTREKLIAEEKLAAVGRLASAIAHEIRNPVAMIASSLATADFPSSDGEERNEMFAIAAREAKRLETFTQDFLSYARPSRPERSAIPIGALLRHVGELTKIRSAPRNVQVIYGSIDEINATLDTAQAEGALLNLALNAVDATPDMGRIELRTRMDGKHVRIEVENSGSKIPDMHLAQIFEPFFTTKARGTGLGLAIARGIARAHGGDLWVSRNQEGCVVFAMTFLLDSAESTVAETAYGEDFSR